MSEQLVFSGRLSSQVRQCFARKLVQITRNGDVIASDTTDRRGRYSVARRIRRGGRYQAVFSGYQFGTHPHNHTCAASSSNVIRIRIR